MGRPTQCKCSEHFCCEGRCHARTIFKWRGDYDFSSRRDLSDFPNYRDAIDNAQPDPTSVIWRIRYDYEDLDWLQYMIDTDLIVLPADGFTASLAARAQMVSGANVSWDMIGGIGPVRDGRMMCVEKSRQHFYNSVPLYNAGFRTGGGWYWYGEMREYEPGPPSPHSRPFPTVFGQTDLYPVFTAEMPWALDIGCIRCGFSHTKVSWPRYNQLKYVPTTTGFAGWQLSDDSRTLTTTRIYEDCHDMDRGESDASYWSGFDSDTFEDQPCVPNLLVWGNRWPSVDPSALPYDPIPAAYEAIETKTAWFRGWADTSSSGQKPNNSTIADIDVIVLEAPHKLWEGAFTAPPTSQYDGLQTWLDLGGKTLVITNPFLFYLTPDGPTGDLADPGGMLAALGVSMRLATGMPAYVHEKVVGLINEYWETTSDPLSAPLDRYHWRETNDGNSVASVTGGTSLVDGIQGYWYNNPDPVSHFFETDRISMAAYETLASGSRVVLCGFTHYGTESTKPSGYSPGPSLLPMQIIVNILAGA